MVDPVHRIFVGTRDHHKRTITEELFLVGENGAAEEWIVGKE